MLIKENKSCTKCISKRHFQPGRGKKKEKQNKYLSNDYKDTQNENKEMQKEYVKRL